MLMISGHQRRAGDADLGRKAVMRNDWELEGGLRGSLLLPECLFQPGFVVSVTLTRCHRGKVGLAVIQNRPVH